MRAKYCRLTLLLAGILLFLFYRLRQTSETANPLKPPVTTTSADPAGELTSLPDLLTRLEHLVPYDTSEPIPNTIFLTIPSTFTAEISRRPYDAWKKLNPDHESRLYSNTECAEFAASFFATVPAVAHAFAAMPEPVLRADFCRYLVLFAYGGFYADIDVVPLRGISEWVPWNTSEWEAALETEGKAEERAEIPPVNSVGLLIGIEADNEPNWSQTFARRVQFCQWTMAGKRGHPALRLLIANIVRRTEESLRAGTQDVLHSGDFVASVMNWTGPGVWTDSVMEYLSEFLQRTLNWEDFTGIKLPKLLGDVLFLPRRSFNAGIGPDDDESFQYTTHMFQGTWKKEMEAQLRREHRLGSVFMFAGVVAVVVFLWYRFRRKLRVLDSWFG